jgi:hypothetical protein
MACMTCTVCVSAGSNVVYDVLTNSLPDSVFPGSTPFSAKAGYTVQLLSSVQVSCALGIHTVVLQACVPNRLAHNSHMQR